MTSNNKPFPIIIYNNPPVFLNFIQIIARGAYYDGSVSVTYEENNSSKCIQYFTEISSPINTLVINSSENIVLAGNTLGAVYLFYVKKHIWSLTKIVNDHYSSINSLYINSSINMFASALAADTELGAIAAPAAIATDREMSANMG